jgi:nitrogen fixation NifU-like protein
MRDPATGQVIDPSQIGEGKLTEEQLIYREHIIDHFRHPRNKRKMEHYSGHARQLNPLCGDVIETFVKIDHGTLKEITFEGKGCAISQATMSMLTSELKDKSVAHVRSLSRDDIVLMLNIPIGPVRMKCAMLGLRTVQLAIEEKL